ncbi:MAG: hypothetical protein ACRDID_16400, partial [Ktedonobacterales bacterium]
TGSQPTIALISLDLILATHRLYYVIAVPALFFPLGYVITTSRILPRALGAAAIGLALVFAALGIADLFVALPVADDIVRSLELLWWFIAALALLVRAGKLTESAAQAEPA